MQNNKENETSKNIIFYYIDFLYFVLLLLYITIFESHALNFRRSPTTIQDIFLCLQVTIPWVWVVLTSKRVLKSRLPLPWLFHCHLHFLSCQSLLPQTPTITSLLASLSSHSQHPPHSLFPPFPEPFIINPSVSAAVSPCPLKFPLQLHRFILFLFWVINWGFLFLFDFFSFPSNHTVG